MYGDAGSLASSVETWQWRPLGIDHYTTFHIGWDTTHSIMCCRLYRNWLCNRLNTEIVTREVGNVWQLFGNHFLHELPRSRVRLPCRYQWDGTGTSPCLPRGCPCDRQLPCHHPCKQRHCW